MMTTSPVLPEDRQGLEEVRRGHLVVAHLMVRIAKDRVRLGLRSHVTKFPAQLDPP
jgi:hypothetical protein